MKKTFEFVSKKLGAGVALAKGVSKDVNAKQLLKTFSQADVDKALTEAEKQMVKELENTGQQEVAEKLALSHKTKK